MTFKTITENRILLIISKKSFAKVRQGNQAHTNCHFYVVFSKTILLDTESNPLYKAMYVELLYPYPSSIYNHCISHGQLKVH